MQQLQFSAQQEQMKFQAEAQLEREKKEREKRGIEQLQRDLLKD